jgi:hypothetical protein
MFIKKQTGFIFINNFLTKKTYRLNQNSDICFQNVLPTIPIACLTFIFS